ncbi:CPBP family intramembrane glutamic endopeptidase [Corynebacterium choanae]|uniref:CPBP family intramembrane glutamic endopeptidase n=1 Tax=Corynebacterium choanae TaxID=1862358 RepID=UPI000F4FFE26|nr:type II CAAX endopeptidase family protein [Corynebacterium choanae]
MTDQQILHPQVSVTQSPTRLSRQDRWQIPVLLATYALCVLLPGTETFLTTTLPAPFNNLFWASVIMYALPAILGIAFYGRAVIASFRSTFSSRPWLKIIAIIVSPVVIIVLNNIASQLTGPVTEAENEQKLQTAIQQAPLWATVALFVIIGPLVEEIIFRHILIGKCSAFAPTWLVASLSAVAFALIHVNQPAEIMAYLPMAVIFTLLYLAAHKQIALSYLAHILNNFLVVAVIPWMVATMGAP